MRIPTKVKRDRTLMKLMSVRRNLLHRYQHCSRRVNPQNPKRSVIEKRRTKERREIADQLRAVERDALRFLGEHTKHPEIYTPRSVAGDPLDLATFSQYDRLIRRWYEARRSLGSSLGNLSRRTVMSNRTTTRHTIARQLQEIQWKWLSSLHRFLWPDDTLPPRRVVHPSRYKP